MENIQTPDENSLDVITTPPESEPSKENKEEKVESPEGELEGEVEPKEEPRVPYKRFKQVRESELEALREKAELEERLRTLEEERFDRPQRGHTINREPYTPSTPPEWWIRLYGDSDASKEAWKIQAEHENEIREEARQYAIDAIRQEQRQETMRVASNLNTIENNLDDLSAYVGRDLTEEEQASVLSIADEYTPKDEEGNYLGALIPFEKAWEVHEMRMAQSSASRKQSRDNVSSLSNSKTNGTPNSNSYQAEEDKNFNPRDWNAWRKKLPQQ